jgi:endonuclease YncB( thermonuclease family)
MRRILQFFLLFCLVSTTAQAEDFFYTAVEKVIDGDTLLTTDGDFVRLLDINTTEISHDDTPTQPFAKEAKQALSTLLPPKTPIKLVFGDRKKDRYKRWLAQVYTEDGIWINAQMVEQGLAHVYSFPDNAFKAEALKTIENNARVQRKGLWNSKRWQILDASKSISDDKIGGFYLVEGTVLHIAVVKGTHYLNFGSDWRTDFTVEIPPKYLKKFQEKGIIPAETYKRQKVRVRGRLKPVNGVLITATHPEQLTILTSQP